MKILVVEDDLSLRKYMNLALTGLGAEVLEADDWHSTMNAIDGHHIDGAFLDLVLQRGSGLDIARHLVEMNIPVVFTSGVSDEYNLSQMHELGWVLSKPVRVTGLKRALAMFGGVR